MVDFFPIVTAGGTVVAIAWGVFAMRDSYKKGRETSDQKIINAIDTRLGIVKTEVEKHKELFLADKTEKEKLILTLKDDIHVLEQHLSDLCNTVAKHEGILESVNPVILDVQNKITELKVKVDLMEKGISK